MLSDPVVYIHFTTEDERCKKTIKATEKLKEILKKSLDLSSNYDMKIDSHVFLLHGSFLFMR